MAKTAKINSFFELSPHEQNLIISAVMAGKKPYTCKDGKSLLSKQFPKICKLGSPEESFPIKINEELEIEVTNEKALSSMLSCFLISVGFQPFSTKQQNEIVNMYLRDQAETIPPSKVKYICQLSESQLCYKRLSFDFNLDGETPYFDELMSRWSNSEAVMRYIGMVLNSEPFFDVQKILWIYGETSSGKGSLKRALDKYLEKTSTEMTTNAFKNNNRFGLSQAIGKRLVQFSDTRSGNFIDYEAIMAHTGGDKVSVEKKNKDAVAMRLDFLPIVYSNDKPEIRKKEHVRRVILCETKAATEKMESIIYESFLFSEAPTWLSKCYRKFKDHFDAPFEKYDASANEVFEENHDWVTDFLSQNFEITKDQDRVTRAQMITALRSYFPKEGHKDIERLKKTLDYYLKNVMNIEYKVLKIDKKAVRGYSNLRHIDI